MTSTRPRVELIPIFENNYIFALIDELSQSAVVVDPGESKKITDFLSSHNLKLTAILITHHHPDHIAGLRELLEKHPAPLFAPLKNKLQIEQQIYSKENFNFTENTKFWEETWVQEGDQISLGAFTFNVMELPGHTLGHVAFWCAEHKWLFSGDVLFGLGCGRLFEGTHEQMFASLQRIKTLPPETLIFCTHEYTELNLEFCKKLCTWDEAPITGDNEELELYENRLRNLRAMKIPSVPLTLSIESRVNPFLLARSVAQFTELRELRNKQ